MNVALLLIFGAMALALFLGVRARFGKPMSLEQWAVGGRGFGTIIVFLLMAGEIYTTFVFLGGSGYAYGHGGAAYYMLGYGSLCFVLSYWLLPPIWRYAKQRGLISQPDFFAAKYDSPALGVFVAIVGVIALIPYLVLQLKGLGIIVGVASYSALSSTQGVWIGATVVAIYVAVSGVHGSAWTSVVKDILVMGVAVFLGLYLPFHYYGGVGPMFAAIEQAKPGFLALQPHGESPVWLVSTVVLSTLGFYMWPHMFMATYTAKQEDVLRRNAFVLPIYQLMLLFIFFVGFAAVLQVPGLKGGEIDLALLKISLQTFDPWFVGVIGAAGVLTALVPASMILMTASTLLSYNVYRLARPSASKAHIASTARWVAPCVMLVAVYFTLQGGRTIVSLLLMAYALVTQLFPVLLASLLRSNPVTRTAAFASIIVGEATVAYVSVTKSTIAQLLPFLPDALKDLNVGIVALILNVLTLIVVTALTRRADARTRREAATL
ncbi:sodium:solute symporter family protein [Paraburkholderia sp. ZP32-5]|uniref:sodium:solute symporter family protein n=1 Tax=Paraburkholderia sp. ZP32-5 TaxID=2883245 RepID=UPI001F439760|nr:sodium:solute symporter [Paraburkholderia sp. ZP32-5]